MTSESGEHLIGLLVDFIKCQPQILRLKPINGFMRDIPQARRQKWARQLRDSLRIMHAEGIYWGDVKPDNLVIDEDDDIWILDMGGSCTKRWVSEHLKDSIVGDREGYARICQYLELQPISVDDSVTCSELRRLSLPTLSKDVNQIENGLHSV